MGEVDGEVGEDLVHLLGGLAPSRPEVHRGGPRAGHRCLQLRLRLHLPHRPAARHRLPGSIPPLTSRGSRMRIDAAAVVDFVEGLRLGVFLCVAPSARSIGWNRA